MAEWATAVTDVRLARPTACLDEEEAFYGAWLPRIASFRDHDGYSGTIWRLGAHGPQFELCAGPQEPSAGAGWTIEEAPPAGVRLTSRIDDCRAFYEHVLGLPVQADPSAMTVSLPGGRGLIRLEAVAEAPAPTIEDMLVFYFSDISARDELTRQLLQIGTRSVLPHNPWWWRRRARCLADPDGIVLALAVDP